jgi:glycyl-tRNA synthetase
LETELFFDGDKIDQTPIDLETIKDYKIRMYLLKDGVEKEYSVFEIVDSKIVVGKTIAYYLYLTQKFLEEIGIKKENLRYREVPENDKAFYSKQTFDLEVLFNEEWIELFSVNYRTDHDLKSHSLGSKKELFVSENGKKIIPHVLEVCSIGLDRLFLVLLGNSFFVKKVNDEERNVLLLKPKISPYFCSILPLMKKDGLLEKGEEIFTNLQNNNPRFDLFFDEKGSIGKRYARLDEIGCNFCVTVDHQTLEDNTLTLRDRDSFDQKRVNVKDLFDILDKLYLEKIKFIDL